MAEAWKSYLRLLQRLPDRLPAAVRLGDTLDFMAAEVTSQLETVRELGRQKVGLVLGRDDSMQGGGWTQLLREACSLSALHGVFLNYCLYALSGSTV